MKKYNKILVDIGSIVLIIGGIILAIKDVYGWGWLIFLGALGSSDWIITFNDKKEGE